MTRLGLFVIVEHEGATRLYKSVPNGIVATIFKKLAPTVPQLVLRSLYIREGTGSFRVTAIPGKSSGRRYFFHPGKDVKICVAYFQR